MPVPPAADRRPPRRALVVCTANICRSPVIEQLLQRALDERCRPGDPRWIVRSAGVRAGIAPLDRRTIDAARAAGVDVSSHHPRPLTAALLDEDGADLVITAARQHVRVVLGLDPGAFGRTFTLRELARRAAAVRPAGIGTFDAWRSALGADRRAATALHEDVTDDLADPYGRPLAEHRAMVRAVEQLVGKVVAAGPWCSAD